MCRISLEEFQRAGRGLYGNITGIARRLNVSRMTVYRFMESNPEAAEWIASQREEFDDMAEEQLRKSILKGDGSMIRFYASTRLKKRGYAKEGPEETVKAPEFTVKIES